ncbi:shikimate kinase [Flavobacteriaceae bacterium]|jgi:shikimate kinase|nr:shikimate kinase [Flavobacteriaceae bacterium]MDB4062687.1 shikimate kinase [Flavobacteriaceae bacterium]MDB4256105.1 shikimate kinase [Flavobacteriaceae bacterium]|tara:strand:+ start:65 stop:595 length:531 start_codon:yes stop_codon:yes gene_type:complete
MKIKKIILLGYMGSGKSAVASQLNKEINVKHCDLDHYIEKQLQKSVNSIFKTKGEIYFRKMERHYLEEVLNTNSSLILSIGGGTPCYYDTMRYLNAVQNAKTIYLNTSILELSKRLFEAQSSRPLLKHLKSLKNFQDFVGKHMFERSYFYNQANVSIKTDQRTISEVSALIKAELA